VLREENQEVDAATGPVVDVHQLKAGDDSDPRLEATDVQDHRVGDGQQQQKQVDGLATHARTQ